MQTPEGINLGMIEEIFHDRKVAFTTRVVEGGESSIELPIDVERGIGKKGFDLVNVATTSCPVQLRTF